MSSNCLGNYDGLLAKVNDDLINRALKKLKPKKRDALFDITSDCFMNGPVNLTKHIANLIRIFIIHGCVPQFVLICTLIPLVKDGRIVNSENYRAIAGGCLLLKFLDTVILLLEGDKLQFSHTSIVAHAT